jgi:anthranilate phosphoribosyltransferase
MIQEAIAYLAEGRELSLRDSRQVAEEIMTGEATPIQVGAFLAALRVRGETRDNLLGFARVMKEKVLKIKAPPNQTVIDTCGTGGDNKHTFNISTAGALIIAGAGIRVAKHGNRSVSSKCGSADVLEELGVNIQPPKEIVERCLDEIGLAFIFAPMCHTAMKYAAAPRREIGIRTIFNMVGPIVNPSDITHHILGVFSKDVMQMYAEVLRDMGLKGAMVVHSEDGMDEVTTTAPTNLLEVKADGEIKASMIDPEQFGMTRVSISDIKGEDKETNAAIMESVLRGAPSPYLDVSILSAGTGIYTAAKANTIAEGVDIARESIMSGSAMQILEALRDLTYG